MGVEVEDMVSQGRRFSVWEGSGVDVVVGAVVVGAPDAGMSSSQGGRGRGSGIDGGCGDEERKWKVREDEGRVLA